MAHRQDQAPRREEAVDSMASLEIRRFDRWLWAAAVAVALAAAAGHSVDYAKQARFAFCGPGLPGLDP
ncbi:MAG: hypothetical protein AAFX50_12690, partial [Acidobacteriota bacterium]